MRALFGDIFSSNSLSMVLFHKPSFLTKSPFISFYCDMFLFLSPEPFNERPMAKWPIEQLASPTATYTTEELMASTEFCAVYRASSSTYYTTVVLRYVRKSEYFNIEPIKENFRLLSQLRHPSISPVIEWFELPDAVCCVSEYFPGRTLRQHLTSCAPFSEDQAKDVFSKILDIVEFFHDHGFSHRNLSDTSLIIGDSGEVRFVGFSFLTKSAGAELIVKDPLTAFDPPETLLNKPTVGVFADCWALGVLLYALVTQKLPWVGVTPGELYYAMTCGNVLKPPKMSTICHTLILRLLDHTPTRRFSVSMAKQQGWVSGRNAGHQRMGHATSLMTSHPAMPTRQVSRSLGSLW
jgi:serine/threonine protein kinase